MCESAVCDFQNATAKPTKLKIDAVLAVKPALVLTKIANRSIGIHCEPTPIARRG